MKKLAYRFAVDTMAMYETIRNCLASLRNLGLPKKDWDPIIIRMAMRKFNNETLHTFEKQMEDVKEFPTVEKLCLSVSCYGKGINFL